MMPSSRLSARCELVFENMVGLYKIPIENAKEKDEWRLTQWEVGWNDNTLQNTFWERIRSHKSIRQGKNLRLCTLFSLSGAIHVHKRILAFSVCVKH